MVILDIILWVLIAMALRRVIAWLWEKSKWETTTEMPKKKKL